MHLIEIRNFVIYPNGSSSRTNWNGETSYRVKLADQEKKNRISTEFDGPDGDDETGFTEQNSQVTIRNIGHHGDNSLNPCYKYVPPSRKKKQTG